MLAVEHSDATCPRAPRHIPLPLNLNAFYFYKTPSRIKIKTIEGAQARIIASSALDVHGFPVVKEDKINMAQINGGSTPHLGGGSPPENKRSREKSGDVDIEARGHSCGLTTTETENREAAVNMLPNSDPTMVQSCAACNKDVTGVRG